MTDPNQSQGHSAQAKAPDNGAYGVLDCITYRQTTGEIKYNGQHLGSGWAGNHAGLNNPRMDHVRMVGPLPRGIYTITKPVMHPRLGPFAMELIPDPSNEMHGRDDFWIHGASQNPKRYHQESMGCIIAMRPLREAIWATGCRHLEVVE